jgi:hypothetical protein
MVEKEVLTRVAAASSTTLMSRFHIISRLIGSNFFLISSPSIVLGARSKS